MAFSIDMDKGYFQVFLDHEFYFTVSLPQKEGLKLFLKTQSPKLNSKIAILHQTFYKFDLLLQNLSQTSSSKEDEEVIEVTSEYTIADLREQVAWKKGVIVDSHSLD